VAGYASTVKKAYMSGGAAQKSRFIVADAGDLYVYAQQQRWKRSSIGVGGLEFLGWVLELVEIPFSCLQGRFLS
jgi:hypothetical protein